MNFVRFPNGKVWKMGEHSFIEGTVQVADFMSFDDTESRLDAISEAATGSIVGLSDFSYSYRGNDLVRFRGRAEGLPEFDDEGECEEGDFKLLTSDAPELRDALAAQYGLNEIEASHAMACLEGSASYEDECVIDIAGSHRQLRSPAHPSECNYVRVLVDGLEIAYCVDDEWRDDPAVVMGAILGAAAGKVGA